MNPINILIVEDQTSAIDRLKRHLLRFGYENIYFCNSSKEAIQLCKLQNFDLAILDINLGEHNSNGIQLANIINENHDIPIIYITGLSDVITLQKVKETSYHEYIVKPFSPQQLFASITLVLLNHPAFTSEVDNNQLFYRKGEIWLLHNRHYEKLELNSISYVQSDNGIIKIVTDNKKYPFSASLNSFERQTNTSFIHRINRKYLVNIDKVIAFDLKDHQLAFLINGTKKWLSIGPSYRESVYKNFHKLKTD